MKASTLTIDCRSCSACCSHPCLTPVLLPSEEAFFAAESQVIQTDYGRISVLKKKEANRCTFLSDEGRCSAYARRPLECRIYPLLLDFDGASPGFRLDQRYCPHLEGLKFNTGAVLSLIRRENLSFQWIKAYQSLLDF